MEKKVRALLIQILGFEKYLALVSRIYLRLVKSGLLRDKYPELFFLEKLIQPGYTCVDIGANVGYYSYFLSKYAGENGKVYAVEPVALFAQIFKKNTASSGFNNITLHQTALGASKGNVTMGTPVINGVLRHGLTSVVDSDKTEGMHTYQVPLEVPDELFQNLSRFDFLKCDVEGYEIYLFPHFMKTITHFKPVIQVEISSVENRKILFDLLLPLGYRIARIRNHNLKIFASDVALTDEEGDFYFLPESYKI